MNERTGLVRTKVVRAGVVASCYILGFVYNESRVSFIHSLIHSFIHSFILTLCGGFR